MMDTVPLCHVQNGFWGCPMGGKLVSIVPPKIADASSAVTIEHGYAMALVSTSADAGGGVGDATNEPLLNRLSAICANCATWSHVIQPPCSATSMVWPASIAARRNPWSAVPSNRGSQ